MMTAERPAVTIPAGWLRTYDRQTGRLLSVGIPSKSEPGKYHLVGKSHGVIRCDCKAYSFRRDCSHARALALALATPAPELPATCPVCQAPAHASQADADATHTARAAEARDIWGTD